MTISNESLFRWSRVKVNYLFVFLCYQKTQKLNFENFITKAYAQVVKMLGNGRLEAMCFDGVKRLCHIRGKLRKKVWINTADIILIGLRDFQDEKADVILKYTADEARQLKSRGEIPENGNSDC